MQVVLKDVEVANAEKGKAYTEKLNAKAVSRGKLTQEKSDELLGRITATADPADLAGCDLVIEAVFEDPSLKAKVFAEVAPYVNPDALLCSNTSTLPITELAEGVDRPADFIGLHFFSPVDKMPLVEIIRGRETSDATLAKAYDVVQQIRKTPIVVNDSRGFYTSRVIGTQINEGLRDARRGRPPDVAGARRHPGRLPGRPAADQRRAQPRADAQDPDRQRGRVEGARARTSLPTRRPRSWRRCSSWAAPRGSRAPASTSTPSGKRAGLWSGLAETFPPAEEQIPFRDVQGPDALRRGARDRQVLRGGRDHLRGRRQHRLDHGHRLPGPHRWRGAVHDRLRGCRRHRSA